jgi:hypothetical protein
MDEATQDPLALAQEAIKEHDRAGIRAADAVTAGDDDLLFYATADMQFYANQAIHRLLFSMAIDGRRAVQALAQIADALNKR